jgi:drug/metabolite transporter (DMT)-like permease
MMLGSRNKDVARSILVPMAAAGLATLLWGAWFPITKVMVTSDFTELQLAFIRFVTAGAIALPILARKGFRVQGARGLQKALVLALSAGVGYVLIASVALHLAPSAYGMLTPVSMAAFSALTAIVISRKAKWNIYVVLSFVLFAAGAAVLLLTGSDVASPRGSVVAGICMFIASGALFSLYNFFVPRWNVQSYHAVALVSFYSCVILLPVCAYAFTFDRNVQIDWMSVLVQAVYQGALVSYVALFLFTVAVRSLGPARAAFFVLAVPAISGALSFVVLGEKTSPAALAAISLLLIGMGLGIYGVRRA